MTPQNGEFLRAHSVFKRAASCWPLEVVSNVGDTVSAGVVEILVGTFCFDNERRGLCAGEFAVALRVADVEEELCVALHVQITGCEVGKLHGALGPVGFH